VTLMKALRKGFFYKKLRRKDGSIEGAGKIDQKVSFLLNSNLSFIYKNVSRVLVPQQLQQLRLVSFKEVFCFNWFGVKFVVSTLNELLMGIN